MANPTGGVWITGYYDVGIALFDQTDGITKQYMHEWSHVYTNEGNYTQSKIFDRDGYIWMATTDGLFRLNPATGEDEHIQLGEGREYIRASDVAQDKNGDIWVTTDGAGLVKLSYNSLTNTYLKKFYTNKDGLTENELVSLAIANDYIWVFSTQNINRFDIKTETAISFPGLIQIPNLNYNISSSYIWNDRLVVSSNRGLFIIEHEKLAQSNFEPTISISTSKTPDNNLIHLGNNGPSVIEDGDIEFKVASLDYTAPDNNKFLYRLRNHNEEWQPVYRNLVSYGHLPPGDYVFEVIGTNADGVWISEPAQYEFTVSRPMRDYVIGVLIILLATFFLLYLMQRKQQITDLHSQIRIDSLTRLPNRMGFNEQLRSSLKIENSIFALAVLDFDGFKDINDIYGHSIGDKFLQEVGNRLRDSIKGRDYIARLSGDEFVLILYHFINEDNLFNIVNRIREVLSRTYELDDILLKSSVSIGIAIYPKDGITRQELFSHADTAMYQAKKLGKNLIYFFNDELRLQLERKIAIKANLEKALERNEFELYYQPKVNPTSMTIVGCEALIRWNHPEQGLVPPDQFI